MTRAESLNGEATMITTKEIGKKKISKSVYYRFLHDNDFEKVSRGIYTKKNYICDPLLIASKRCPRGVLSHDSALYHFGLLDREPAHPTLTIYSGYNTTRLKQAGYKVYFVKKELLEIGRMEASDLNGNVIPMYNLERTVCDLVRNRNDFEFGDFVSALKAYARKKEKNLNLLLEYAKLFRVEKILRSYLEVLI